MMNDMLSQEEIDALLRGDSSAEEESDQGLSDIEKDAIGEIGNINMGNSATTLSTLLGKRVNITTPRVEVIEVSKIAEEQPVPYVAVKVSYREGLNGMNLLVLKESDVKVIASLMMGGDGASDIPEELNEIHLSAISEAMNQMVGSSSTSLSEMISKKIDISPPEVFRIDLSDGGFDLDVFNSHEKAVRVSFRMTIENLIDSNIMQLIPIDFAKNLVDNMLYGSEKEEEIPVLDTEIESEEYPSISVDEMGLNEETYENSEHNNKLADENVGRVQSRQVRNEPVQNQQFNINPVQFESFSSDASKMELPENIELIKDVFLKVTVELGRTTRSIDEILSFGPGTIIELEKLVGEPLNILVNGKKIAKGEVVVIDENYGIRITDILKPNKRLSSL